MKHVFVICLCGMLLMDVQLLHAQSPADIDTVALLKKLNINDNKWFEGLGILRVKPLPFAPESLVVVIPKVVESNEITLFDGYVLIVNNRSNIISKFYRHNMWSSDALRIRDIIIDTAPYRINKDEQSFGIRVVYDGSSRPNPFWEEDLYLFVQRGDSLVNILDKYVASTGGGEWDLKCTGDFEEKNNVFIMDKLHQTNRYNNIIVKTKITETQHFLVKDDCKAKSTVRKITSVLKFINGKYRDVKKGNDDLE